MGEETYFPPVLASKIRVLPLFYCISETNWNKLYKKYENGENKSKMWSFIKFKEMTDKFLFIQQSTRKKISRICLFCLWFQVHYPLGSLVYWGRVFTNGPGNRGSILDQVIPKTSKWHLMPPCLTFSIIKYGSRVVVVGDRSRPEDSFFNNYYTKMLERSLLLSLDCSNLPWYVPYIAER